MQNAAEISEISHRNLFTLFPLIPYLTYTNRDGKRDLTTTFSFVYFYLKCPGENAGNGISEALKFRSP